MIALIDIGNTRTKFVHFSASSTKQVEGVDPFSEVYSVPNQSFTQEWLSTEFAGTTGLVYANVSDAKYSALLESWAKANGAFCNNVNTEQSFSGVINGYQDHEQMGVDRWLALLGTKKAYPLDTVLIIDSGTATTYDVLDGHGQHHGGWILPGVEMMTNSVLKSTVRVKGTTNEVDGLAFGKNTSDNLSLASWAATIGAIEQAIKLVNDTIGKLDRVVITGGNGRQLMAYMQVSQRSMNFVFVEKLIFDGLSCYLPQ